MKPIIGIPLMHDVDQTTNLSISCIYETLRRSVQRLGADIMPIVPVIDVDSTKTKLEDFPCLSEEHIQSLNRFLALCDGFILPGGNRFIKTDQYILDYAIEHDIPILGICLGMQMMSCYKEEIHLEKNDNTKINHQQNKDKLFQHQVQIVKNSLLFHILGQEEISVNSFHNYHATANSHYKAVAFSGDGLIEAIEYPKNTFNLGVQWHPERSIEEDVNSKKLLKYFIEVASSKSKHHVYEELK